MSPTRPTAPIPRAVEPADPVLAKAVAELRAAAPEWDWATRVLDLVEAQGHELAELRPLGAAVKSARRAAWTGAGTAVSAVAMVLWFAVGRATDYGDARGTARAREEQRLEDRQTLQHVLADHQSLELQVTGNTARLEGLTGQVRTLWSMLTGRRPAPLDRDPPE